MKDLVMKQCHLFEREGNCFVFVVDTLQLYQLEKDTFKKVKDLYNAEYGKVSFERRASPFIKELISAGVISSVEHEKIAEQSKDKVLRSICSDGKNDVSLSNVVLQIANDCNLNCKYCYGDGGAYGRKRELMSFDVAKKGIDYLVANRGDRKRLQVTFFGGEPLLNFELIKKVIAYCEELEEREKIKFGYSMTTNGTIVSDEILSYIKKYRFSLLVSMDGGKLTQDCYRCYADGKGSFDVIQPNIPAFREANGGRLSVRATVCKPNTDMVSIRKELMGIGFDNVIMSMVDTQNTSPLFVGDVADDMKKQYSRLAKELIKDAKEGRPINNTMFNEILRRLYYKKLTFRSCGAGSTGFAIGSDGNFYPCHRYMGMEDYISGNVNEGITPEKLEIYKHVNVLEKEECKECWVRYLCGGGCSNTCVTQAGDVMKAPKCYCDIYKGIYEEALYIYYELKSWDDDYFRKILDKDKDTVATIK